MGAFENLPGNKHVRTSQDSFSYYVLVSFIRAIVQMEGIDCNQALQAFKLLVLCLFNGLTVAWTAVSSMTVFGPV